MFFDQCFFVQCHCKLMCYPPVWSLHNFLDTQWSVILALLIQILFLTEKRFRSDHILRCLIFNHAICPALPLV